MIIKSTHNLQRPQLHARNRTLELLALEPERLRHLLCCQSTQAHICNSLCLGQQLLRSLHLTERSHGFVFIKEVLRPEMHLIIIILLFHPQSRIFALILVNLGAPFVSTIIDIYKVAGCVGCSS